MPTAALSFASGRKHQRGSTLIEALIAFALLAVGLLSLMRLHALLEAQAEITRQRAESVRLAQQDLETLRGFAAAPTGAASAVAASFDDIASTLEELPRTEGTSAHTRYRLSRNVDAELDHTLKSVTTRVAWTARDGAAQHASLVTAISSTAASLSGTLTLVPASPWGMGIGRASPTLPLGSRQVDDRRGVVKPFESATVAWVIDAVTGQVMQQCEVGADRPTSRLAATDLTICVEVGGLILDGVVRFSDRVPPDAADANDPPLDVAISVGPAGAVIAASPGCFAEARKTVSFRRADGVHREAVPISATPEQSGVTGWTELGERFVAYRCLVPAAGDPLVWSGRSNLVPMGWSIGNTAVDRRVCRFVDDRNGNGTIDRNEEHPADYRRVDRTLEQQNFLVIRGDQSCPVTATTTLAGDSGAAAGTLAATEPHQP